MIAFGTARVRWRTVRGPVRALGAVGVLGALAALASCGLEPKPLPAPGSVIEAEAPANPFAPVGVRVHPLTRLVPGRRAGEATTIDAHIELIDQAGDSVKGAGLLTIELYRGVGPISVVGQQDQVMRWALDLAQPETNRLAYDRVTRTYRVTLTDLPAALQAPRGGASHEENLSLRVRLTTPGGRQVSGEARLGW